jgi:phage repressor protein C with HTH and peptisase S24 domain
MEPTLHQGDLTLIDETRTRDFSGQVFALIDIDGMTRLKRLDRIDQATLALRSDNPDYRVELRRGQEMNGIKILGQVVWSGHTWK